MSFVALAAASIALPGEAEAQATPGSAQCPIIARIVTCSGSIPEGISVPAGSDRDGLTVENLTSDVTVTTRPAIAFTAGTPTSTIRIVDPDNALRVTTTTPTTSGREVNLSAILATATNNANFSLLSDIDIFGRTICPRASCAGDRALQVVGLTVRGSLGNFTIDNRGDMTIDADRDAIFTRGAAIVADIFNADLVSIRNSGVLNARNSGGIIATADNRRIEIVNDGTIRLTEDDPNALAIDGAISLQFESFQNYSDGFTRPDVPQFADFTYRIVNNGTLSTSTTLPTSFPAAIIVSHTYVQNTGMTNANSFYAGRQAGEIINNGTIGGTFGGISIEQNGDVTVTNNGLMQGAFGIDVAQLVYEIANPGPVSTTRIVNTAQGVIDIANSPFASGIFANGGIVDIMNAGRIGIAGDSVNGIFVRGSSVTDVFRRAQLFTIANSGEVVVSGPDAVGIGISRTYIGSNGLPPDQRSILTNSGAVTATGDGAIGLYVDNGGVGGEQTVGTVDIELTASSVVRGGSGLGVGVSLFGGERNTLRNAGLITATSGNAIASGIGAETIDNSGRIEGSVVLGEGNDRVIARDGGVYTGTVNGEAGNDTLQFDIATGSALFTDRFGGTIRGFEVLEKTGAGTLSLTQVVADRALLLGGTLSTSGDLSGMGVEARAGTTIEATGMLGGIAAASGVTFSPGGGAVGTVTVIQLNLGFTARLRFDLGAPGMVGGAENDLINATNGLTLDGFLDVNARPNFGSGVYRLINYGGTLINRGLEMGNAPAASYTIQTSVAGQVNLVVDGVNPGPGPAPAMQFWDGANTSPNGAVDGGAGTWNNTLTNWTRPNGDVNEAWGSRFAIFQATPGTATIDAGGVSATGLQFAVNGYTLTGGTLTLTAPATLRVGDGSAGGAAYGATISAPIAGTAGIDKTDLGTLILSGANTYTGGTRVSGGTLQVSADTALGAASGGVTLDGGTFRAGGAFSSARGFTIGAGSGTIDTQANSLTLSGILGGAGALTKAGSGTLVLSGNSAGFAGATTISGGLLNVSGSLGGTLTVGNGGRLGGTGTLGNVVVGSGGILAPGNSTGTLNATGNIIFRAGSFYDVELAAAGATDLMRATGTATLEGGTVRVTALDPETQYAAGTRYTILTAGGGRTGTFAGLTESSAFLDFALSYDANNAFVTVNVVRTFPDVAQTFNQQQASSALMRFNTGGADALAVYNQLLLLDADPARAAFDLASGEIYAVSLAASLRQGESFAARLLARSNETMGANWGLWAGVAGLDGRVDGDGNGARFRTDGFGGELGVDYRGAANMWAVGVGGGYANFDAELPGRRSDADGDGWHLGGYARFGTGGAGFTLTASAAYARMHADARRTVAFGALTRSARARIDVDSFTLAAEARYGFRAGTTWSLGPLLRIGHSRAGLDDFAETGADSLNLSASDNDDRRTRFGVGGFARFEGAASLFDIAAGYAAGGRAPTEVGLAMAGATGTPFQVRSARGDGDSAFGQVGTSFTLGRGWSVDAHLRGTLGHNERTVAGQIAVTWQF